MNNRKIAAVIIGLCILSLLVGIINTATSPKTKAKQEQAQGDGDFLGFYPAGDKIALVSLDGAISSDSAESKWGNFYSAESVRKALRKIYKDESVKGVLFKINSPGGTVAMSQEIYNLVMQIRTKKPVVVSMTDVAASGGYYIASAADRIYANPGTLTGSIGVIFNNFNAQELLNQKLGVKTNIIKSGRYKDIGSPYRQITPDERALLQNIIDTTYNQFLNAIKKGRIERKDNYDVTKSELTMDELKQYADGRIFTGEQAQKTGFVDKLGGLIEAQAAVNQMARKKFIITTKDLPLVPFNRPSDIEELLFGAAKQFLPMNSMLNQSLPFSIKYPNQTLYMWE